MMVEVDRSHPLALVRSHPLIVLWVALGLGSALLRLIVLDRLPLNATEASYALPAWQAILGRQDGSLVESGAPFLSHSVAVVFALFGASDVAARLIPAVAGVGLVLTPALLIGVLGHRTCLWAAVLIALSPIAVQSSRVLDPATVSAALAMAVVCSAVRLATDRPWWAAWALALVGGLSLAAAGGAVLALIAAGWAALILVGRPTGDASGWRGWLGMVSTVGGSDRRALAGPAALFAGTALLVATGALTDLRGVGFVVADVWAGAFELLAPDAFPTRNLASLLGYAAPLLLLAIAGYLLALREARPPRPRERRGRRQSVVEATDVLEIEERLARRVRLGVVSLLGLWAAILLVVAAVAGGDELTLALLPIAPLAVLAGTLLARLPLDRRSFELTGDGWTILAVGAVLAVAAIVIFSQKVAAGLQAPLIALVALLGLLLLLATGWRNLAAPERTTVFAILGGIALLLLTISGVSRASFGGSPSGTELLARDDTDPAFRAMFRELNVLASADPSHMLVVDLPETGVARWYGRSIPATSSLSRTPPGAWVLREATGRPSSDPVQFARVPWKMTSEIESGDVYALGMLRWLVSRSALVHGKPHDIIVVQ